MTTRDYAMARLAAAQTYAADVGDSLRDVLTAFLDPSDDKNGEQRLSDLDELVLGCHAIAGELQLARAAVAEMEPSELALDEESAVGDDEDDDDDHDAE